jgi:type IV pilus assembly protein PilX
MKLIINHKIRDKQQGVILIVALVMLLVMTIAGVTTMTGSTLQEKIAGNQRQQMTARINADQGLKAAENYLDSLHPGRSINSVLLQSQFESIDGLYTAATPTNGAVLMELPFVNARTDNTSWLNNNSIAVPSEGNVLSRYVIEYMGAFNEVDLALEGDISGDKNASKRKVFRITAIGFGGNVNVYSVLESYYFEASQQ